VQTELELANARPANDAPAAPRGNRRGRLFLAVLAVAAVTAAVSATTRRASPTPLVADLTTPRAWFDDYLAAAVDDPARVCHVLLAPELAASYRHTTAGSCMRYFGDVQDSGVRIQRIVHSSGTAVIELRQSHPPVYRWSVVLGRHGAGWRAVAVISDRT
jgi:hypothetical protein